MKPLEHPDNHHLEAAKGWCELHAYLDANEELEKISPALRAHPDVLELRWQVYANLKNWAGALEIATAIVKLRPDWPNGYLYRSTCLTELGRHMEAHQTLSEAASRFPKDEIILYDLACICCALKRVDEARLWLGKAIEAGGREVKFWASHDSDLEPIWREIEG